MPAHIAIIVDWYGPYSLGDTITPARDDFGAGLYMAIGRKTSSKEDILQYVGISKNLASRLTTSQNLLHLNQGATVWLGEVSTVGRIGAATIKGMEQVALAEWLLAFYLQPKLNERKTTNPPSCVATLINRWWKTDYETPRRNRPHKDWPDIIDHGQEQIGFVKWVKVFE